MDDLGQGLGDGIGGLGCGALAALALASLMTLALALLSESHEALTRGDRPVPTRRREHR